MWRNYVTVAIRSLLKNRIHAFINIFGLALGFAACLMILLYVRYELSYDKWLPNSENVYQLQTDYVPKATGEHINLQVSAYVAAQALQDDFEQIESRVYIAGGAPNVIRDGQAFSIDNSVMVDNRFFDVLPLPMLHGDPATALSQPGSLVLSRTEAERFFGTANPVGQSLTLRMRGEPVDHRITGVIEDLPDNSHMRFNMIVRFEPSSWFADSPDFLTSWGNQGGWIYVKLKDGSDPEAIRAQMPAWEARNIPGDGPDSMREVQEYRLINVRDVHLGDAQIGAMTPGNDRTTIITFGLVALLVLSMAVVNFVNLATAAASKRAREVALRKVLGARRKQLITQFLGESIVVASLAMLLALTTVELLLAAYSSFLDADLSIQYLGLDGLLFPIIALVLIVGIVGGLYPAFYLSNFQPARILKANKSASESGGSGMLRNILVVGQFAVSIGLIICTAVVYAQTVHARTVDPGYQSEGILQLGNIGDLRDAALADSLMQQVARLDGVAGVTRTDIGINAGGNSESVVSIPGRTETADIGDYSVAPNFFETMNIDLIAGRLFDEARPADDTTRPFPVDPSVDRALAARGFNIVINELAVRILGFRDAQDAVGKQVRSEMLGEEYGPVALTIIGVVENARFRSVRQPLQPTLFLSNRSSLSFMMVRYNGADPRAIRDQVEAVWKRLAPDIPFDAEFSEDILTELYGAEEARAQTFAVFTLLAVLIACLGLFGLAAFTAERRTKEIGIRKVFGARSRDIVKLLAWQFSKPVIVANLIAWPVAWWVMRDWLNTFDARIDLGPTPFVLAGLIALVIAIGTISGHAIKVARANPIKALRYE